MTPQPDVAKQLRDTLARQLRDTCMDVLTMAAIGGMPDTFWDTDQRIKRACEILNWTTEQGRSWAQGQT